jgi:hypothetical protein
MESGDEELPGGDPTDIGGRPQDDYVSRRRPRPSDAAPGGVTISGVLGDSEREGFRRLYLTQDLNRYVEFASADVIEVSDVPADQPPFVGDEATSVTLRPDAHVDFTRTHTADEFDIQVSPLRMPEAQWDWLPPGDFWTHRWWCPWAWTWKWWCRGG